jgi:hypothetical protein
MPDGRAVLARLSFCRDGERGRRHRRLGSIGSIGSIG